MNLIRKDLANSSRYLWVNDMEEKRKPEIRFKGFTEDWEQRKLIEILENLQNNTLSRAELSTEQGIAKNVHYGDILIKFGEYLDIRKEALPMITDELIVKKYKSSYLKNGDIVVADTAEDQTVGKCSEIAGVSNEIVLSGLHTIPYRPLIRFASGYLGYYMNSGAYHKQLFSLMQGIKVTSISKSAMQNTVISYPKLIDEQKKIGLYFNKLDNLITLHQRKYDKLLNVKKSMLEKMFPKNTKNIPELRFKGFTDDWEQRKLGEYLVESKIKGNTGDRAKKITVKLWGKGVVEKNDFGGSEHTQYYIRKSGQFIYSKLDFLNAAFGVIPENLDEYESTADLPAFDLLNMNPYFLLYKVIQEDFYLTNGTIADGSRKAKRIHADTFLKMSLNVPSLIEQERIKDFLITFDTLITLHQRKLEKLKNIKKSMLEKMFL